jgi:protein-tyrosine-phosphatase
MKHILFICTGNTCRSPLAEYLLREKAGDQLMVKSAGVAAANGGKASVHVETLLQEKGIEMNHASQMVTQELMEWADLVLTMTDSHKQYLSQIFPAKTKAIHTLKEYVSPSDTNLNISDPFGGTLPNYRATMVELEELINQFVEQIKRNNE